MISFLSGASFLLHQIRKMVALVMAIRRGLASIDFISQAFTRDYSFLPIAPGLGLVLEDQHFDYYNKKHGSREAFLEVCVSLFCYCHGISFYMLPGGRVSTLLRNLFVYFLLAISIIVF